MSYKYTTFISIATALVLGLASTNALAMDVKITQDLESIPVHHGDKFITIQRNQDQTNVLSGGFTKTSRKCPPFCIQPLKVAPGVTTVGELELLKFIDKKLEIGEGIVIDARTPSWHKKGTIPGAVNMPFTTFKSDQPENVLAGVLGKLNVSKKGSGGGSFWSNIKSMFGSEANAANSIWDFSQAKEIALFCNGMWCGQSPTAIKNLLAIGYPPEKIYYYRGGMQAWQSLGLTVYNP